jgi:predicted nuclease of predicted toxin-antitoxin system
VRILLDECLPRRLARELAGHDARTVPDAGWAGKRNGELLSLAQGKFDVFLTVDRNLSFQHEVHNYAVAVVVLHAKSNKLSDLRPLVPELLSKLHAAAPGEVVDVGT